VLIEHWGQADPQCDIGPKPWGDGIVDEADLKVLMNYWGQEIPNPALVAHWKLDETSGAIAADSVGTHDGMLIGAPLWQPAGGQIDGALQLDGIDDYVRATFVVDPSTGPFSVFAWIKGGAPGQVVVSQVDGANWLMLDPATGTLKTDLQKGGRSSTALCANTAIDDGNWHRVGFTWDNSSRILYVDDAEVARDTQPGVASSRGYMIIGAGSTLAPGSFWKGLIDQVQIYDPAVQP
jgi:Concanavalin A-like lectin/glucanases superfamily